MCIRYDLHSNTRDDICPVPKRDIPLSARGRIPRHNNQIQIHQDVERQNRVPDLETGSRQTQALAALAHENQTHGQCQVEQRSRVDLQVDNKVEGVSSGRCNDHNDGKYPFDEVGTKGCAEGAGGGPETWVGKDSLSIAYQLNGFEDHLCCSPSTFTNLAGRADQYGEQVAKSAQRNQEVQTFDGTARTEDMCEE